MFSLSNILENGIRFCLEKNIVLQKVFHIWSESNHDNFWIPKLPKTVLGSPKRALSDRTMGDLLTKNVPAYGGFCIRFIDQTLSSHLYEVGVDQWLARRPGNHQVRCSSLTSDKNFFFNFF